MNVLERIRRNNKIGDGVPVGVRGTFPTAVKIQGDGRTVDVIANTDDIDLVNEVVVPSGADTSYFFRNGNVFVDHQTWTVESAVGRLRKSRAYPSNLDFSAWRVEVFVRNTPLGDDILTMVKEDGLGVSIGFIPTDYGRPTPAEVERYANPGQSFDSIVRTWKWLELSFTAFPCNVNCQSMGVTQDTSKAGVIESLLTKSLIRKESALAVGFPIRPKYKILCNI